jgi:thiosulfate/3-mercaptopyruvate sulfurtransferase
MKKKHIIILVILLGSITTAFTISNTNKKRANGEPWKPQQLMEPAVLAAKLEAPGKHPVIFDIGPSGVIKEAIEIGPGQEKANIDRLKKDLASLDKSSEVVVYCGCCPFKNCPNIRPAFEALNEAGFKNSYLLNLPENLRVDWIAKGYPMSK